MKSPQTHPVLKRLLAGLAVGTALTAVALPATAAVDNDLPVRWNTGGAVWSTSQLKGSSSDAFSSSSPSRFGSVL